MAIIRFPQSLIDQCKACAEQRDRNRLNSIDYSSDKTPDKGLWSFIGVVGEVALLKYFDLAVDWLYLSTDEGFGGTDVGDFWEVRATTKMSNRLFMWQDEITSRKKLACAWSKVVVDLEQCSCHVVGWAMGYEIAQSGIAAKYDCKRASKFLDNKLLRIHSDPSQDHLVASGLRSFFLNPYQMEPTTSITPAPAGGSVFSGIAAFEDAQRIAKALASSTLIPPQFQGQQGFANCLVALEIANRMRMSPFQVMQNLHIIHGRPSWSSQFIIALINGCGRFEPLQYELAGKGEEMACRCSAVEKASGKTVTGPAVSMAMARAEGWSTKAGSKWKTMPELMLRYRAAAMFGRLYVPDLLVGIQSQEEVVDIQPVSVSEAPAASVADLNAAIAQPAPEPAPEPESDELF